MYRSTPEILRFHLHTPFSFSYTVLLKKKKKEINQMVGKIRIREESKEEGKAFGKNGKGKNNTGKG